MQAAKYIPIPEEKLRIVTPDDAPQQQLLEQQFQQQQLQQQLQSQQLPQQFLVQEQQELFKPIGIRPSQINYPQILTNGDDLSGVIVQAQDSVNNGLARLRQTYKSQSSRIKELQTRYDNYFKNLRQQTDSNTTTNAGPSAGGGGLFQNVLSGIQSIANNFVGGNQNNASGEGDPQRPSFGQSILNTFNQITTNLTSSIGQQTPPSTVLGDTQTGIVTSSPPANNNNPLQFIQGVISNLNPFNNNNNKPQGSSESDEGNNSGGNNQNNQGNNPIQNLITNLNPFNQNNSSGQGIVSQVSQAVSNLNPFNQQQQQQQQPQGDTQQGGPFQNAVSQIGQVFNNLNPFNQQQQQQQQTQQSGTPAAVASTEKTQPQSTEAPPKAPNEENVDKQKDEIKEPAETTSIKEDVPTEKSV